MLLVEVDGGVRLREADLLGAEDVQRCETLCAETWPNERACQCEEVPRATPRRRGRAHLVLLCLCVDDELEELAVSVSVPRERGHDGLEARCEQGLVGCDGLVRRRDGVRCGRLAVGCAGRGCVGCRVWLLAAVRGRGRVRGCVCGCVCGHPKFSWERECG